jgi:hypothetical protein
MEIRSRFPAPRMSEAPRHPNQRQSSRIPSTRTDSPATLAPLEAVRRAVVDRYAQYVRRFLQIADPTIREVIERELFQNRALWADALRQLNPTYAPGQRLQSFVDPRVAHGWETMPEWAEG